MSTEAKKHADSVRAKARRQQVLDAAEACFAKRGFHAASMAEISQTANMSAGHIYNYFENKEAIIAAIAEQKIESMFVREDETLQAYINRCINEWQEVGHMALMFDILAEAVRNPKMAAVVRNFDQKAQKNLEEICAQKFTLPHDQLKERVRILRMLVFGFKARRVCDPDFDEKAISETLDCLFFQLFEKV